MKWICQICHIVRSVRESDLWSVRPCSDSHGLSRTRPLRSVSPKSDRPLTHTDRTPGEAMRLAVKSVRRARGSHSLARCAWEADRTLTSTGRSNAFSRGSVRERPRDAVRSSALWLAQTDHMRNAVRPRGWEAEFGLSRPLTASDSLSKPIKWLGSGSESAWEAVRGRERPWEAENTLKMPENLTFDSNSTSDSEWIRCAKKPTKRLLDLSHFPLLCRKTTL